MDENEFENIRLEHALGKIVSELIHEKCVVDALVGVLEKKELITKDELREVYDEIFERKHEQHRIDILNRIFNKE